MKQTELNLFFAALLKPLEPLMAIQSLSQWLDQTFGTNTISDFIGAQTQELDLIQLASHLVLGERAELTPEASNPTYLEDIFNRFKAQAGDRYLKPMVLTETDRLNKPVEKSEQAGEDFKKLFAEFETVAKDLTLSADAAQSWLNLLNRQFAFVPCQITSGGTDISLAEHCRLTAAFALAIYRYQEEKGLTLSADSAAAYQEQAFLMASFDFSGIQDFIYNIVSKGALKQLKARSLYLDVMSDYLSDSLLEKLSLSRANLLYVGGGHAYFILPNTEATIKTLEEFELSYNQFLLEQFQTRLYVAFGWTAFSGKQLMVDERSATDYRQIYQETSRMIAEKKLQRYDGAILKSLNAGGHRHEEECQICHAVGKLVGNEQKLCQVCDKLSTFARQIKFPYFAVTSNDKGLPLGPGAYLIAVAHPEDTKASLLYSKNDYSKSVLSARRLYIGDYTYSGMHDLIDQSDTDGQGIRRLGVLRLDVDDLGAAFMAGFSNQNQGKYNTLARSATFSRSMSRFFKEHLNTLAEGKNILITYAGGDDVFAIGYWEDMISFAIDLRQDFISWTGGKLTLSAGLGLFTEKSPVHIMASQTGDLESGAKNNDKDSISLFSEQYTFKFDQFINNVYDEKLQLIRDFFSNQDERGNAFIYKLIDLLQNYDRMAVARLAYLLARLEDSTKKENKDKFKEFKKSFYDWYRADDDNRLEAELALMMYVYETRKDN